ncbi:putative 30S ribosomal subunit protein S14 [Candidatus Hodgkinia cicadicola Dsem]|nr:putative 30S ribosomal subunit protein S14 [Candidatus Hodgkinia cicadicola Dsem]
MSRLGALNNHDKLSELVQKHAAARLALTRALKSNTSTMQQKLDAAVALARLPRRSSKPRRRNRCFVTGRPRGYYRLFGVSRIVLRQMANAGLLPGVAKSSW